MPENRKTHPSRIVRTLFSLVLVVGYSIGEHRVSRAEDAAGIVELGTTADPQPITAGDVRPHIEYLSGPELQGRGGAHRFKAAEYLRESFQKSGLQPLFAGGSYFQSIPNSTVGGGASAGPAPLKGINVGGWVPGSDPQLCEEFVIISAHYDHLGVRAGEVFPGADDNASGVAMMLETAREIAARPVKPKRSIVFVGFDLEEELLWGSRWFAAHPPWELERVKLFITADMIGRSLGDLDLPTVFVLGSECAPALKGVLETVPVPDELEISQLGIDLIGTRSDYGPFRDRQIPFLFFSTGQHADYHTPRDIVERVNCDRVAAVSNVVLSVATAVADAEQTPEWTDDIAPDLDEVRTIHRITRLMLDADERGTRTLGGAERFFVSQLNAKTANAIRLGRLTAAERLWLARSAKLLLLSVF